MTGTASTRHNNDDLTSIGQVSPVLFNLFCKQPPENCEMAAVNSVSLRYDKRQRSRFRTIIDQGPMAGSAAGIDLPRGTVLGDNTLLQSADGQLLLVRAAPEDLIEVTAGNAITLTRLAYHLGNRHVPIQIVGTSLRLQPDHVLSDMVKGLGGTVTTISGPFDPEAGAYTGGHSHGHDHKDDAIVRDVRHGPRIHDLSGVDKATASRG